MKDLSKNKKAFFDYNILETFQAGIVLLGLEVKSIKKGQADLNGAYVILRNGEAFLINAHIPPYQGKNTPPSYNPERTRKLLLRRKELNYLHGKTKQKGLTLIPLRLYNRKSLLKLEFALAKGKKKFDKREAIKNREIKRKIDRIKNRIYTSGDGRL